MCVTCFILFHISELRAFKEQHGHVNVPRKDEHKKLYRFLDNQGQNYRKLLEGKKSTLTVQRIKDLDEVRYSILFSRIRKWLLHGWVLGNVHV